MYNYNFMINIIKHVLHARKVILTKLPKPLSIVATFKTNNYKLHKLTEGPSTSVSLNRDDALRMYEEMFTMRWLENVAATMYKEKSVRGFCHLYNGQEACTVGIKSVLRPNDSIITAYRVHGLTNIMDVSVFADLEKLTGRQGARCRGEVGLVQMFTKKRYGQYGTVGAHVPLGIGIAFAAKYRDQKSVCITIYGDGVANQGQVFEVFNMAKLFNIPCIFVCENNGYGMGISTKRSSAVSDYYTRGDYIPGIWVDGMDVLAVKAATKYAIDYCDSGKGPIIIELATCRFFGHSMSDPDISLQSHDEVQELSQNRDPATILRDKIVSSKLATDIEIKEIESKVRKHVSESVEKSKAENEIPFHSNSINPEVRNLL